MFTISSSQGRVVNFSVDQNIQLPTSYSNFLIFTSYSVNSGNTEISFFSSAYQYYSSNEYLFLKFKNLSVDVLSAKNEIVNKLYFLNFDQNKIIYSLKNITDNEVNFYIKSYTIDNFVKYLSNFPYVIKVNFLFDEIEAYALSRTFSNSLTVNSFDSGDRSYNICKS
jgi:hypothetical protein